MRSHTKRTAEGISHNLPRVPTRRAPLGRVTARAKTSLPRYRWCSDAMRDRPSIGPADDAYSKRGRLGELHPRCHGLIDGALGRHSTPMISSRLYAGRDHHSLALTRSPYSATDDRDGAPTPAGQTIGPRCRSVSKQDGISTMCPTRTESWMRKKPAVSVPTGNDFSTLSRRRFFIAARARARSDQDRKRLSFFAMHLT